MARLIDIDQKFFLPVASEVKGTYEEEISVEDFFIDVLDFKPEIVDAIPMEWMKNKRSESMKNNWELVDAIDDVLKAWKKEQEVGK